MSRPPVVDESRILAVARELFLARGVGVTTAEVAARADVSEGSVFNRFRSKAELFHAAMRFGGPPDWLQELPSRVGRRRVERELRDVSLELLEFFRKIVPLAMMAWSDPATRERALRDDAMPTPVQGLTCLADYLGAEMKRGRLRRHDPLVAARTWTGAIWSYVCMETCFGAARAAVPKERPFVTRLVDLLLGGLAPEVGRPAEGGQREPAQPTRENGARTRRAPPPSGALRQPSSADRATNGNGRNGP